MHAPSLEVRAFNQLEGRVTALESLPFQVAACRGDFWTAQAECDQLRSQVRALEERVRVLEDLDQESLARLQREPVAGDSALGCLCSRVLHLQRCFQHLVLAVTRAFPRPAGFWQSLEED